MIEPRQCQVGEPLVSLANGTGGGADQMGLYFEDSNLEPDLHKMVAIALHLKARHLASDSVQGLVERLQ